MTYTSKVLPLVTEPDPKLHIKSKDVEKVTEEIQQLMQDMLATIEHNNGIGLAAVQVGVMVRVAVMDIRKSVPSAPGPIFLVNPVITKRSEETTTYCEGCLSLPHIQADVVRPSKVTVECLDYNGNKQIHQFEDLLAICVQHEIDHTNGIIFLDHLSRLKKEYLMKKLLKHKKK